MKTKQTVKSSSVKIKIDKGIPIPSSKGQFPFDKMEVGDSFFSEKDRNKISTQAYQYGVRTQKKFSVRAVDGGFRVWRLS